MLSIALLCTSQSLRQSVCQVLFTEERRTPARTQNTQPNSFTCTSSATAGTDRRAGATGGRTASPGPNLTSAAETPESQDSSTEPANRGSLSESEWRARQDRTGKPAPNKARATGQSQGLRPGTNRERAASRQWPDIRQGQKPGWTFRVRSDCSVLGKARALPKPQGLHPGIGPGAGGNPRSGHGGQGRRRLIIKFGRPLTQSRARPEQSQSLRASRVHPGPMQLAVTQVWTAARDHSGPDTRGRHARLGNRNRVTITEEKTGHRPGSRGRIQHNTDRCR